MAEELKGKQEPCCNPCDFGDNWWIWIIIIIAIFCLCGNNGFGGCGFDGGSGWLIPVILIIVLFCCCNGNSGNLFNCFC